MMLSRRAVIGGAAVIAMDGIEKMLEGTAAMGATDPFVISEYQNQKGVENAAGRTQVSSIISAPSTTKTIIIGGQSNHATSCGTATYTTVSSSANNLSIYDGGIYLGVDPVLGPTYAPATGLSSITMRFADRIIAQAKATRVIVANCSTGGTPFAIWEPNAAGGIFTRISVAILRCRARGLEPDFFIWGQGETDNLLGTSAASVKASIWAIVDGIRAMNCNAPFYIGKFTMVSGATSATVQTGIADSVDAGRVIRTGYDADTNCTVAGGFRLADQTHLSNTGLTTCANGWADLVFP